MRLIAFFIFVALSLYGADVDGFRDIKWGDSPTKNMVLIKEDASTNIKQYYMSGDKLSVGEATLTSINYWYFNNRFMGAFLQFSGFSNFGSLKSTLESKHGTPYRPNRYMDNYLWAEGNSRIGIQYSSIKNVGIVMIMNDSMGRESDQYKKDLASKAVKDL